MTREWRLTAFVFEAAPPLKAQPLHHSVSQGRRQANIDKRAVHKVIAEIVSGTRVRRLRLDTRGRIPSQTIVSRGEVVVAGDIPVNLRKDDQIVTPARQWTGKAVQE